MSLSGWCSSIIIWGRDTIFAYEDTTQSSQQQNCQVANENFSAYQVQMKLHAACQFCMD